MYSADCSPLVSIQVSHCVSEKTYKHMSYKHQHCLSLTPGVCLLSYKHFTMFVYRYNRGTVPVSDSLGSGSEGLSAPVNTSQWHVSLTSHLSQKETQKKPWRHTLAFQTQQKPCLRMCISFEEKGGGPLLCFDIMSFRRGLSCFMSSLPTWEDDCDSKVGYCT